VQAAKTASEATETAAREAEEAANKSDALEATSKAAVAAWRASQVRIVLFSLLRAVVPFPACQACLGAGSNPSHPLSSESSGTL
jgi:hypothetical protein